MNNISTPRCPHFDLCSGCDIQLSETPPVWKDILAFFEPFGKRPKLRISTLLGWRLKAKLAIRGTSERPIIGLFQRGTHRACSIPHCLVHHKSINQAVLILSQTIQKSKISIYNEKTQSGLLRYAQFFVGKDTGLVQLAIVVNASDFSFEIDRFFRLLDSPLWHSVWINFHPEKTNRVLGSVWKKIAGEDFLYQPLLDQKIAFHPGAFAQAHLELFEELIQTIRSWVIPNSRIVELFAGVGAIGLFLEPDCKNLLLMENNPFAEISFRASLKKYPKCEYRVGDASLFNHFSDFDLVIVDPPRKGLGAVLLKNLSQADNLSLIYVSCGWESFQKDCQALLAAGWFLEKAEGFLLFPGTNHVETVSLFKKNTKGALQEKVPDV